MLPAAGQAQVRKKECILKVPSFKIKTHGTSPGTFAARTDRRAPSQRRSLTRAVSAEPKAQAFPSLPLGPKGGRCHRPHPRRAARHLHKDRALCPWHHSSAMFRSARLKCKGKSKAGNLVPSKLHSSQPLWLLLFGCGIAGHARWKLRFQLCPIEGFN